MRIGISGGGGDLAKRVINQIIQNGLPPSRLVVGSRNPGKLGALSDQGVEVRRVDFSDADSVCTAFAGCERVLLTSIEDPLFDVEGKSYHATAVQACAEAGVKHILYTSAIGAFLYNDGSPYDVHANAEWQLEKSGCDYTVIRNGLFSEMVEFDLRNAIELDDGVWVTLAGEGVTAWINKDDIARSVAVILRLESPSRLYTLTGPVALTHAETVEIVNRRFGMDIVHESVSPDEFFSHFEDLGQDPVITKHLFHLFSRISEGHCSVVTHDVERLTGMKPASFIEAIQMD